VTTDFLFSTHHQGVNCLASICPYDNKLLFYEHQSC
jgi:hypothetical protein